MKAGVARSPAPAGRGFLHADLDGESLSFLAIPRPVLAEEFV